MTESLNPWNWTPEQLQEYVKFASIVCGLLSFVTVLLFAPKPRTLNVVIAGAFAGAGTPTGIAVILCAFRPTLVKALEDLQLYLALTGAILIFVSIDALASAIKKPKPLTSGSTTSETKKQGTLAPGHEGEPGATQK